MGRERPLNRKLYRYPKIYELVNPKKLWVILLDLTWFFQTSSVQTFQLFTNLSKRGFCLSSLRVYNSWSSIVLSLTSLRKLRVFTMLVLFNRSCFINKISIHRFWVILNDNIHKQRIMDGQTDRVSYGADIHWP